MSATCYCKKCKRDVPPADSCPYCGGKLPRTTLRVAWCVRHRPVADWICWNAAARIILPVWSVVVLIVILAGLRDVHLVGQLTTLCSLLVLTALGVLAVLCMQGDDLTDCVVDSRGVHIRQYLPDPTPLKLLARFRAPRLPEDLDPARPLMLISERELKWADITRVQLWPEKTLILLYAPSWWMRLCICCDPFSYPDVLDYMRDKVGRRKNLLLPRELVAPPKPKAPRAKSTRRAAAAVQPQQLSMDDLPLTAPDYAPFGDIPAEVPAPEEPLPADLPIADAPAEPEPSPSAPTPDELPFD